MNLFFFFFALQLLLSHSTIYCPTSCARSYFCKLDEDSKAKWSMHSSFNFLFTTSAAGFSGRLAGHLAGKDIQRLNCLEVLEESQQRLTCIFHSNLLTHVQGHMELEADPSRQWVVGGRCGDVQVFNPIRWLRQFHTYGQSLTVTIIIVLLMSSNRSVRCLCYL